MRPYKLVLDEPQPIDKLRELYNDSVTFISSISKYPYVDAIEFTGGIQKALRRRIVPLDPKKKVDRILASLKDKFSEKWDVLASKIRGEMVVEKRWKKNLIKFFLGNTLTKQFKVANKTKIKRRIKEHLKEIVDDFEDDVLPSYEKLYSIGKERGQGITGQPLDDEISEREKELIAAMLLIQVGYLDEFMNKELYGDLEDLIDDDYGSEFEFLEALDKKTKSSKSRMLSYTVAGLGALALGMAAATQAAKPELGEIKYDGGYWHTFQDFKVCPGCEEQEGRWMTMTDFIEEYQTNDCLTNCRCAELFEVAPNPEGKMLKVREAEPLSKARTMTICIDLDGTIFEILDDVSKIGPPIPGAREFISRLKAEDYTIIIHTVRGDEQQVASHLRRYRIPFDYINYNPNQPDDANPGKPIAEVYIDDRAIQFKDNWPEVYETVKRRLEHGGIEKGGPGSGSWEGPGQPRFAWTAAQKEKYSTPAKIKQNLSRGTKVIISGELDNLSPRENAERSKKIKEALEQYSSEIIPQKGKYKGTTEKSFLASVDPKDIPALENLAFKEFGQAAYIKIENGKAQNIQQDGTTEVANVVDMETDDVGDDYSQIGDTKYRFPFKSLAPVSKTNEVAYNSAQKYLKDKGFPPLEEREKVVVNPTVGKKIAEAYEKMKNEPNNPEVVKAYKKFADEVSDQYKMLPVKIEWTKGDPYKSSREMLEDVERNNRLRIFTGGKAHPLLGERDSAGISLNDKFRAVHDYFGHVMRGNQFGTNGEENAWVEHSNMFSPLAQRAMTTETRGQNSWFNFSRENINRERKDRKFAEQKVGILPEEFLPRNRKKR